MHKSATYRSKRQATSSVQPDSINVHTIKPTIAPHPPARKFISTKSTPNRRPIPHTFTHTAPTPTHISYSAQNPKTANTTTKSQPQSQQRNLTTPTTSTPSLAPSISTPTFKKFTPHGTPSKLQHVDGRRGFASRLDRFSSKHNQQDPLLPFYEPPPPNIPQLARARRLPPGAEIDPLGHNSEALFALEREFNYPPRQNSTPQSTSLKKDPNQSQSGLNRQFRDRNGQGGPDSLNSSQNGQNLAQNGQSSTQNTQPNYNNEEDSQWDSNDDSYDSYSEDNDQGIDEGDPNAYRLIIPNRYVLEDFLLAKSARLRKRIEIRTAEDIRQSKKGEGLDDHGSKDGMLVRYRKWKEERELAEYDDEDLRVDGIDSDLELFGGINLETYNKVVLHPSQEFNQTIIKSRTVPDQYQQEFDQMGRLWGNDGGQNEQGFNYLTGAGGHQNGQNNGQNGQNGQNNGQNGHNIRQNHLQPHLNLHSAHIKNGQNVLPIPIPLPGVSILPNSGQNGQNLLQNGQMNSTWSKLVGSTSLIDKTASKRLKNLNSYDRVVEGADYLKQRLNNRFPEVADKIRTQTNSDSPTSPTTSPVPTATSYSPPPLTKRQQFMNVAQKKVFGIFGGENGQNGTQNGQNGQNTGKNDLISETYQHHLPPSKQSAKGYSFSPRDAYEAQMFIVHRIQTDNKLRQALRDTFKFYTKELDPISAIDACRHLLSIELYLYLKTLEDTGVKLDFDRTGDPKEEKRGVVGMVWDRMRGKDQTMSTSSVMALIQQYRTRYLELVLQDESGELLAVMEEEWVQMIHLVAEVGEEVIRNAFVDQSTAYELLTELYRGVSSEQYMLDFEDQLNCILIQFAKQRREKWDGEAYNGWKENRLSQLRAGLVHYQSQPYNETNLANVKHLERQIRQIELMGDDADDAEQINNDHLVDQIIQELDMPKLKLYVNNALLYYYRNHLYSQYGFENDIGALLMTKALYSIPDLNVVYYLDDISDSANRCRDFTVETAATGSLTDDDDGEGEWDDEEEEINRHDMRLDLARDRLTKRQFKQQVMREKLDPDYNENFNAGFRDWFRQKQTQDDENYEDKKAGKRFGDRLGAGLGLGREKVGEKYRKGEKESQIGPLSKDYLDHGMPQYDGKYDRYGLPNIQEPMGNGGKGYSHVVERYQQFNERIANRGRNGQNGGQNGPQNGKTGNFLETGQAKQKWLGMDDKRK